MSGSSRASGCDSQAAASFLFFLSLCFFAPASRSRRCHWQSVGAKDAKEFSEKMASKMPKACRPAQPGQEPPRTRLPSMRVRACRAPPSGRVCSRPSGRAPVGRQVSGDMEDSAVGRRMKQQAAVSRDAISEDPELTAWRRSMRDKVAAQNSNPAMAPRHSKPSPQSPARSRSRWSPPISTSSIVA